MKGLEAEVLREEGGEESSVESSDEKEEIRGVKDAAREGKVISESDELGCCERRSRSGDSKRNKREGTGGTAREVVTDEYSELSFSPSPARQPSYPSCRLPELYEPSSLVCSLWEDDELSSSEW